MERLGNNQEKKPERSQSRLRELGRRLLASYIESHRHGDFYVSAVPHGGAFILPVGDEANERLFDPERDGDDRIIRGEE